MKDRTGYFTYEQITEMIKCVESDPIDLILHDHLESIKEKMERYHMLIISAHEVVSYDVFYEKIVTTYKIVPSQFKSTPHSYLQSPPKISAPDFKSAECCENCVQFYDTTEQDDLLSGICEKHSQTDTNYDPPLISPLFLSGNEICKDFVHVSTLAENNH